MHGRGSDQGGRWPVGIWFALVGVSAGTVASFAMVGWAFTRGLYDGTGVAEPYVWDSEMVIIEAEETTESKEPPGSDEDEAVPEGWIGPVAEAGTPSSAAPQAEPAPEQPEVLVELPDEEPPRLVPVEEHRPACGRPGRGDEQADDDRDDKPVLKLQFEPMELPIEDRLPFVSVPRPKG